MRKTGNKTVLTALLLICIIFSLCASAWTAWNDTSSVKPDTVSRQYNIWKTVEGKVTASEMLYGELRYYLYLPEEFDPAREYPLIVYLHSSNCCYNDLDFINNGYSPWFQTLNNRNYQVADNLKNVLGDCIIFAPQCPGDASGKASGTTWTNMAGSNWASSTVDQSGSTEYLKAAETLMDQYIASGVTYQENVYRVNGNRVYLIGDSMGAIGAYAMLADCPTSFAAAMIRAGIGDPDKVPDWKDTPVRIVHGTNDTNIPYAGATIMINALTEAGAADAQLITVQDGPHDVRYAMYTQENFDWLAAQSRSAFSVRTLADLETLRSAVNEGSAEALAVLGVESAQEAAALDVSLGADLTVDTAFAGIGSEENPYSGVFDGNGHTITFDLSLSGGDVVNSSLFRTVVNGSIRNVNLAGSLSYTDSSLLLAGTNPIAPLAGNVSGTGSIADISSSLNISYDTGEASGTAGEIHIAGIVGVCQSNMTGITSSGSLTVVNAAGGNIYAGGIACLGGESFWNGLVHTGTVSVTESAAATSNFSYVGGIAAVLQAKGGSLSNSRNEGAISYIGSNAWAEIGGMAGEVNQTGQLTISGSSNSGTITVRNNNNMNTGGAVGRIAVAGSVTVKGFLSEANISTATSAEVKAFTTDLGGVTGLCSAAATLSLEDCAVTASMIDMAVGTSAVPFTSFATYGYVGGLLGRMSAAGTLDAARCFISSTVKAMTYNSGTAQERTGGFAGGLNNADITEVFDSCFFAGKVAVGGTASIKAASSSVVYNNAGTKTFIDCGHCSNSAAALPSGMYKFDMTQLPDEGMVAAPVTLTGTVWGGTAIPAALTFEGEGISLNEGGELLYASEGSIEVTAKWLGYPIGTKTVSVLQCDHQYGEWQNTAVDTHSKTCALCGDVITEPHVYVEGVCVCGRREDGVHTHEFAEEWDHNDLYHWHSCTYPGCDEVSDKDVHSYEDGVCTVCGAAAVLEEEGYIFSLASQTDYDALLKAVNEGDAEALAQVAQNIAGDAYVNGMTTTQAVAASLTVRQTADFTIAYPAEGHEKPVGIGTAENPFSGEFDGNGFTLTFAVEVGGDDVAPIGLFGTASGSLHDAKLSGSILYEDSSFLLAGIHTAPLAAVFTGQASDCESDLDITYDNTGAAVLAKAVYVNGLIGNNYVSAAANSSSITNCTVSGDITVKNVSGNAAYACGVVHNLVNTCSNLTFSGSILVEDIQAVNVYAGGIAVFGNAFAGNVFENLLNTGTITVKFHVVNTVLNSNLAYIGGIVAHNGSSYNWTLKNCVNTGAITMECGTEDVNTASTDNKRYNGYIGGIAGYNARSNMWFDSCSNSGAIMLKHTATGSQLSKFNIRIGGIMGCYNATTAGRKITMNACTNTGAITVEQASGRYAGSSAQVLQAGGIIGQSVNNTALTSCVNEGAVSTARTYLAYVGGIIGEFGSGPSGEAKGDLTATNCINNGAVYTSGATLLKSYVGGFAGRTQGAFTVLSFTNTGNITANVSVSTNANRIAYVGGVIGVAETKQADYEVSGSSISGAISGKCAKADEDPVVVNGFAGNLIGLLGVRSNTEGGIVLECVDSSNITLTADTEAVENNLLGRWPAEAEAGADMAVVHSDELVLMNEKEATCYEPGYTGDSCCSRCMAVITPGQEIEKTSHTESDWQSDENQHWKVCTVEECGEEIEGTRGDHEASEWIVDTEADIGVAGEQHKECTVCGRVLETEIIPALEDENTLTLTFRHNCEFADSIALHYAIPAEELEGYTNICLNIEMERYAANAAEPTIQQYTISEWSDYSLNGQAMLRFVFREVYAVDMGNTVKAYVTAEKDGTVYTSQTDTYSVKTFAYNRLAKSTDTAYKKLLVDMLHYGAAAQAAFKKNTAHPVNADLTDEQLALGTQTDPELFNRESTETLEGATAFFQGKNLVYDSNVFLRYRFYFAEGQSMDNVKIVFSYTNPNGVVKKQTVLPANFGTSEGMYTADCTIVIPSAMRCIVSAVIYDGSTPISDTLYYSIETYTYNRLQASTDEDYKALIRKMMNYGISALEAFYGE